MFGGGIGSIESQVVYILLFIQIYYLNVLEKDYLYFKVKVNLMDYFGFFNWYFNKFVSLWCGQWGCL